MQLLAIMTLAGLINIVGVGLVSEHDLARRGMDNNEYQATVEVEDVSAKETGSLLEAIQK